VPAEQPITTVQSGVFRARFFGHEVGTQCFVRSAEGAPDELLHFTFVEIDAGAKHGQTIATGD